MLLYAFARGFYAELERLRNRAAPQQPVVIGGDIRKGGTVQSASAEARAAGVTPGMPVRSALQRCPEARALRSDMRHYRERDDALRAVLRRTSPRLESAGLGAAYIDVERAAPAAAARQLRAAVQKELQLQMRVGAAPVKFLAKLAAEENDAERLALLHLHEQGAVAVLPQSRVRRYLAALPAARLPGVGPNTAQALLAMGCRSAADFAALGRRTVEERFGNNGLLVLQKARGLDAAQLRRAPLRRSVSQEATLGAAGVADLHALNSELEKLAAGIERLLAREKLAARKVVLKLHYADSGRAQTRSRNVRRALARKEEFCTQALALLGATQAGSRAVRRLGLAAQTLVKVRGGGPSQPELFGGGN